MGAAGAVVIGNVAAMEAGLDRRVARLLFVGLALVVLGTTALTESPPVTIAERPDDPYAFAAVVVRARTADTVSHATTWLVERTDGERRDAEVVELARTPAASVEVSATAVTVHRGARQWSCTDVAADFECLEVVAPPGPTIGSAGLFVTAAASGAYRFERRPDRRVAGGPAECFGVVLVGIEPVPGIGS